MTTHQPTFPRPTSGDCPEYYFKYIDLVPEVDIATLLHTQRDTVAEWIEGLSPEQCSYRYAEDKWTLGELIGHIMDTERVFSYRMLVASRNDKSSLPSFEQDDYVKESIYGQISPSELASEWRAIRASTLNMIRHMNSEMAARVGTANNYPFRASAFPYIMAGHVIHHYQVAQERYMASAVMS